MSTVSVMPSNYLTLCRPFLLLPSVFPSIRVFSNESALCIMWPKYWSSSFNISPSNEHQGLISFRMDWLDLLVVQGTLKCLLQHHSSKASILCSAFFTVQLSHLYLTTGKTIALTRWTFVGKVMPLLFNMLQIGKNSKLKSQFKTQIFQVYLTVPKGSTNYISLLKCMLHLNCLRFLEFTIFFDESLKVQSHVDCPVKKIDKTQFI